MAITWIGDEEVTWGSGADPAGVSITIPSDCTLVLFFWAYYTGSANEGISTLTLNSVAHTSIVENVGVSSSSPGAGISAWYNPSTGSQTIDVAWDNSPSEGPVSCVAYLKGAAASPAERDSGTDHGTSQTDPITVTVNSSTTDTVAAWDVMYGGFIPGEPANWTTQLAGTANNSERGRLSTADSPGASTTTFDGQDEKFSACAVVSIKEAAAGGAADKLTLLGVGGG